MPSFNLIVNRLEKFKNLSVLVILLIGLVCKALNDLRSLDLIYCFFAFPIVVYGILKTERIRENVILQRMKKGLHEITHESINEYAMFTILKIMHELFGDDS